MMIDGCRLFHFLFLLTATFAGKTESIISQCIYGSVTFDEYTEKLELRNAAGRCLCFYEVVCKDPNDPECRVVKHLQFGCDQEIQGDDPQTSTILKGRLKIHFDVFLGGSTTAKKVEDTYSVTTEIMAAKEAFLNKLAIARRNGPNDIARAKIAERMIKMWTAGLFSASRKYAGGDGRIHFDSSWAWLPLATSSVLLAISAVLYVIFRNYDSRKEKNSIIESATTK